MPASVVQRRIALLPASTADEDAAPLRLIESMLWAFQGTTSASWQIATPVDVADIAVVSGTARNASIEAWRDSGRPLIVITTADAPPVADEHVLLYPFRATQFLKILNQLDARLSQPVPAASGSPVNGANQNSWGFIDALRTLREVQNSEVWLAGTQGRLTRFWVKGDGSEYATDTVVLQEIRRGAFPYDAVQLRRAEAPPSHRELRSTAELQWFAGYHAGTQLAPGLDESTPYRLTRWPNFGLIRPMPSQIRATALLAAGALTVGELARRGQLTLAEATQTLNALEACGLLQTVLPGSAAQNPSPPATESPQPPGGIRSLLRLIRKRLGLGDSR